MEKVTFGNLKTRLIHTPSSFSRIVEGDASEAGILKCMEDQYGDIMAYRALYPKICEIPFNSTNKFQVSIHETKNTPDLGYLLVMKVSLIRRVHKQLSFSYATS